MLFAAEILRWVVAGAEAMFGFGKEGVLMFKRGVLIPIPTWCLGCAWETVSGGEGFSPEWWFSGLTGAGVEGDSVPYRELLAPDLGVMLVESGVPSLSLFLPGDRDRTWTSGSFREATEGDVDPDPEPASLGVSPGFPFRKLEDRAGVRGFEPFNLCLSADRGMAGTGERRERLVWEADGGGCSRGRMTATGRRRQPELNHDQLSEGGRVKVMRAMMSRGSKGSRKKRRSGIMNECLTLLTVNESRSSRIP